MIGYAVAPWTFMNPVNVSSKFDEAYANDKISRYLKIYTFDCIRSQAGLYTPYQDLGIGFNLHNPTYKDRCKALFELLYKQNITYILSIGSMMFPDAITGIGGVKRLVHNYESYAHPSGDEFFNNSSLLALAPYIPSVRDYLLSCVKDLHDISPPNFIFELFNEIPAPWTKNPWIDNPNGIDNPGRINNLDNPVDAYTKLYHDFHNIIGIRRTIQSFPWTTPGFVDKEAWGYSRHPYQTEYDKNILYDKTWLSRWTGIEDCICEFGVEDTRGTKIGINNGGNKVKLFEKIALASLYKIWAQGKTCKVFIGFAHHNGRDGFTNYWNRFDYWKKYAGTDIGYACLSARVDVWNAFLRICRIVKEHENETSEVFK